MTMKLSRPYIVFLPSTSLVDTVDSQRSSPKFLASYLFAAPGAAKFLSEQIDSRVSYINQIPQELLSNLSTHLLCLYTNRTSSRPGVAYFPHTLPPPALHAGNVQPAETSAS